MLKTPVVSLFLLVIVDLLFIKVFTQTFSIARLFLFYVNISLRITVSFLFYFILFYFILFYFILFYFILFYFILFYFILFYFTRLAMNWNYNYTTEFT